MADSGVTRSARNYALTVLTVIYVFNFIDRQILVILQESIKVEMGLSDTQLGLLTGFSFAVFYVTCGIPIARWADRGNRRNIVALSLTVWSVMTAISGLVANFVQLLLARIGVGVGEAGGSPPAHSMISDYFPFEERGRALSIYTMGVYIGILFGFLAGGWLNEYFGWRVAFFVVGIPGIALALILRFTVREPLRGAQDRESAATVPPQQSMLRALAEIWAYPAVRYASLGAGFNAFVGYGVLNFMPSFLSRVHGLESGTIGTFLSLAVGIGGAGGAYLSGYLADRLGRHDKRWYPGIPAISTFMMVPFFSACVLLENLTAIWIVFFISSTLQAMFLAPLIAASHAIVGPRSRAMASALVYFVLNIIGLGLGPLFVGLVSDLLEPAYAEESLRWSMLLAAQVGLLGGWFCWLSAKHFPADLQRAASS